MHNEIQSKSVSIIRQDILNETIQKLINQLFKSNKHTFDILDRVGGGDAFTAGILHGILNEMKNERILSH